jgi:hypothetical protein
MLTIRYAPVALAMICALMAQPAWAHGVCQGKIVKFVPNASFDRPPQGCPATIDSNTTSTKACDFKTSDKNCVDLPKGYLVKAGDDQRYPVTEVNISGKRVCRVDLTKGVALPAKFIMSCRDFLR